MSKLLRISPDLAIPDDVVTATSVVYGGKGMGKTNLASVLVEEATKARLRWAVLDPMGVFWGLRHSTDGTGPGVECVILGGPHGDIPIEPTSGEIVADLVIDEGVNTVIDFSRKASGEMWGKGEKVRFVTDYALRLFRRQGDLLKDHQRREPLLQILDEAARYIPQVIPHGAIALAECVGAWEQIAEEGRNIGLGVCFLTQRSARMNKSVSELADVMFAFRTIGPNSLAAVMDWLGEHIEKSRIREVAGQVRELEIGQALVVSPGWLRVEKVVKIRARETFDSSATPKPGQRARKVTGKAAQPDLAKYRERMATTIEKAKADDPKELKKKIVQLETDLRKRGNGHPPIAKTVEKRVIDTAAIEKAVARAVAAERRRFSPVVARLQRIATTLLTLDLPAAVGALAEAVNTPLPQLTTNDVERLATPPAPAHRPVSSRPFSEVALATSIRAIEGLSKPQARMLQALASFEDLGIADMARSHVAVFSNQSPRSSAVDKSFAALRTAGLIENLSDSRVRLTDAGRAAAGPVEVPASLEQLHKAWYAKVSAPQERMLWQLIHQRETNRGPLSKEELAERTEQSPLSSGYDKNLSTLRSLGLIEYKPQGYVTATELLFPEGLT
jgi:Mn-dependent DtxR family transcriptional regulator